MKKILLIAGFLITTISMASNVLLVDASQERQENLVDELEAITIARNLSEQYLFESTTAMQAAAQLYTANAMMTGRPETGVRINDLIVDSLNRAMAFSSAALETLREVETDATNDDLFADACPAPEAEGRGIEINLVVRPGDSESCDRPEACDESTWLGCGDDVKKLLVAELAKETQDVNLLRCRYDQLRQADHAFGVEWRRLSHARLERHEVLSCRLRKESARTDSLTTILTVASFFGVMVAFAKDLVSD